MKTNNAIQNLDNLIATSQLTRVDHIALEQSLQCLGQKARLLDTQEQEAKDAAKKAADVPDPPKEESEKDN